MRPFHLRIWAIPALILAMAPGGVPAAPAVEASPLQSPSQARLYTIRIGSFRSVRMAGFMRKAVENLGPARVERVPPDGDEAQESYRVLVGKFETWGEASQFAKDARLGFLFPGLSIEPLLLDAAQAPGAPGIVSLDEQERDPYQVSISLFCEGGRKHGEYKTALKPEAQAGDSDLDLNIHWSCGKSREENWSFTDAERNPSFFGFAPITGMGGLSTTNATTGNLVRFNFHYGIQLSAFKSFGGMGPTLEYRVLNHRYTGDEAVSGPVFDLEQRVLAGVRLPFAHRFELEPSLGFGQRHFLLGTSAHDVSFRKLWLPQMGGKVRVRALELTGRGSIDLAAGFQHLFSATSDEVSSTGGSVITAQIRARHFAPSVWGADWFLEFDSITSGTPDGSQSESRFSVGASILFLW